MIAIGRAEGTIRSAFSRKGTAAGEHSVCLQLWQQSAPFDSGSGKRGERSPLVGAATKIGGVTQCADHVK